MKDVTSAYLLRSTSNIICGVCSWKCVLKLIVWSSISCRIVYVQCDSHATGEHHKTDAETSPVAPSIMWADWHEYQSSKIIMDTLIMLPQRVQLSLWWCHGPNTYSSCIRGNEALSLHVHCVLVIPKTGRPIITTCCIIHAWLPFDPPSFRHWSSALCWVGPPAPSI